MKTLLTIGASIALVASCFLSGCASDEPVTTSQTTSTRRTSVAPAPMMVPTTQVQTTTVPVQRTTSTTVY